MSATKTNIKAGAATEAKENVIQVLGQVTLGAAGIGAVVIGLWSTACMVGGMIAAGGPFKLAFAWMGAVGGF